MQCKDARLREAARQRELTIVSQAKALQAASDKAATKSSKRRKPSKSSAEKSVEDPEPEAHESNKNSAGSKS